MNVKYIIGAGLLLAVTGCLQDSKGEKVGSITRLSREGLIPLCKTWEAEIIRGGLTDGSGSFGQAFHFTIDDTSLVDDVRIALEGQKEVKIHYHHEHYLVFGSCSSRSDANFLDGIEIINRPGAAIPIKP